MSRQNVELVQAIMPLEADLIEVVRSDDPVAAFTGMRGAILPDLEVVFEASPVGGPALTYQGLEGMIEGWRDWLMPWASYWIAIEDFVDGGDHVVVPVRVVARTERDGVEVTHRPAAVWTVRDGKLVAVRFYLEQTQAFEYAGLTEPAP
jgi:ketosteroid isomerase-like protein